MKIRIETNQSLTEDEIIIRCQNKNEEIRQLQISIEELVVNTQCIPALQGKKEIYLSVSKILFFETSDATIYAHTKDDMYETSYKLYELEDLLPGYFIRISKSSIANIQQILSINRNLTASSIINFQDTYKQAYVSRHYFKLLKTRLEEKRLHL